MPLTVAQGPLPANGERVDPALFLEEWINGSSVQGLDQLSFHASLHFITTQTAEPTGLLSRRGTIWFKRGTGAWYFRDEVDRGDSRYTGSENNMWLAVGPSREIAVEIQNTHSLAGVGMVVGVTDPESDIVSGSAFDQTGFETVHKRFVPFYRGLRVGTQAPTKLLHSNLIATTSAYSGLPARAIEWGFALARIASGGSNVARGAFGKISVAGTSDWSLHPRSAGWTGETSYQSVAIILATNASSAEHNALVFKKPGPDWAWSANI